MTDILEQLDFAKYENSLIPTIVQDIASGQVLMLGFSSRASLEKTIDEKKATFFSRSKNALWTKGETSGNTLSLHNIHYDCDNDTLLFLVEPQGPACHTGEQSCFFQPTPAMTDAQILWSVYQTVLRRKKTMPEGSYTASLFSSGLDRIAQKVGEEAVETVIAAKNTDQDDFVGEFSDLLFHMMVLLAEKDISLHEICEKFAQRIQ